MRAPAIRITYACRNVSCRAFRAVVSHQGPCGGCGWVRIVATIRTGRLR